LESEQFWKKTHLLGGRMWLIGGVLIAIISFIIHNNVALLITMGAILFVVVIVPVVYSFIEFQKEKRC